MGAMALAVISSSCEKTKPACAVPLQALVKVNFYQVDTNGLEYGVLLPNAYIGAAGNDSLYAKGVANMGGVALPLEPGTGEVRFFIRTDSTAVTDTVRFTYTQELKFISNACGYTYFFNLNAAGAAGTAIDSVKIVKADVNNTSNDQNVKIYYR
jgi:hypothetical protein